MDYLGSSHSGKHPPPCIPATSTHHGSMAFFAVAVAIPALFAPLVSGLLMDHGEYRTVWLALVGLQLLPIASACHVRRVRRTASVPA